MLKIVTAQQPDFINKNVRAILSKVLDEKTVCERKIRDANNIINSMNQLLQQGRYDITVEEVEQQFGDEIYGILGYYDENFFSF